MVIMYDRHLYMTYVICYKKGVYCCFVTIDLLYNNLRLIILCSDNRQYILEVNIFQI